MSSTDKESRPRDRTFGPAVLVGVTTAALAAAASSRTWVEASADSAGVPVEAVVSGSDAVPLAAALSLVVLASWGVLLVTRGRVRQVFAMLGLLAAGGVLAAVGTGFAASRSAATAVLTDRGATGGIATDLTAWPVVCGVAALLTALALAVAVRRSPAWPAMGSRYDAPTSPRASRQPAPVADSQRQEDMWRAMDDGRDPTQ